MSDIVDRLRSVTDLQRETERSSYEQDDKLALEAADTITRLTAEVAEYEATFDAAWEADMRGVQMWREAHPGNDMVLPDRANFTSWILAEIMRLRSLTVAQETLIRKAEAEIERLKAGLRECELELNAYYRMEYPSNLPYSQKKLAQAMASNPATVALSGDKQ